MNNKAVFILSVVLAFVLGILAGNLYQRCAMMRGCGTMACAHGAGHPSMHGACGGHGAHGHMGWHKGWHKRAMGDCCARTAAGDPQECCAKHEKGDTQECCARAKGTVKGEAAGLEITGAALDGKKDCCHRGAAK